MMHVDFGPHGRALDAKLSTNTADASFIRISRLGRLGQEAFSALVFVPVLTARLGILTTAAAIGFGFA